MTQAAGDWRSHPEGRRPSTFLPVRPAAIVGLGAICGLEAQRRDERAAQSFTVAEFVRLVDGRLLMLHDERGFMIGWGSREGSGDLSASMTIEDLTQTVLNVVLPDDDECGDAHPWEWLADLARARGLTAAADDLRGLPYEVVLADDVRRWLGLAQ